MQRRSLWGSLASSSSATAMADKALCSLGRTKELKQHGLLSGNQVPWRVLQVFNKFDINGIGSGGEMLLLY